MSGASVQLRSLSACSFENVTDLPGAQLQSSAGQGTAHMLLLAVLSSLCWLQVVLETEPGSHASSLLNGPVAMHASLELLDQQVDVLARKLLQVLLMRCSCAAMGLPKLAQHSD